MGNDASRPLQEVQETERRLLGFAKTAVKIHDMPLPRVGESIHYCECQGRGEIGGGKPLIIVHGYAGGVGIYYRMMKFLVERWGGVIYFLDLPGQGCSERKERFFRSPAEVERFFTRRLTYWLDCVIGFDKKIVWVAHSFGGYISTAFCHTIKDRLAALILLSPCFGFPKSRMPHETEKGFRERMIEYAFDQFQSDGGPTATVKRMGWAGSQLFRSFVRSRFASPPPEPEFEALLDYLVGINCECPPGTESGLFATFGQYLVTKAEKPLIERVDFSSSGGTNGEESHDGDIPVISFYGDSDWMDRQGGAYIGDIGVIAGCTHHMHLEYPRLVTRCIMYFVKHNVDVKEAKLEAKRRGSQLEGLALEEEPKADLDPNLLVGNSKHNLQAMINPGGNLNPNQGLTSSESIGSNPPESTTGTVSGTVSTTVSSSMTKDMKKNSSPSANNSPKPLKNGGSKGTPQKASPQDHQTTTADDNNSRPPGSNSDETLVVVSSSASNSDGGKNNDSDQGVPQIPASKIPVTGHRTPKPGESNDDNHTPVGAKIHNMAAPTSPATGTTAGSPSPYSSPKTRNREREETLRTVTLLAHFNTGDQLHIDQYLENIDPYTREKVIEDSHGLLSKDPDIGSYHVQSRNRKIVSNIDLRNSENAVRYPLPTTADPLLSDNEETSLVEAGVISAKTRSRSSASSSWSSSSSNQVFDPRKITTHLVNPDLKLLDHSPDPETMISSKMPRYTKRPYKKIIKLRRRNRVWWANSQLVVNSSDIREFRKDYSTEMKNNTTEQVKQPKVTIESRKQVLKEYSTLAPGAAPAGESSSGNLKVISSSSKDSGMIGNVVRESEVFKTRTERSDSPTQNRTLYSFKDSPTQNTRESRIAQSSTLNNRKKMLLGSMPKGERMVSQVISELGDGKTNLPAPIQLDPLGGMESESEDDGWVEPK